MEGESRGIFLSKFVFFFRDFSRNSNDVLQDHGWGTAVEIDSREAYGNEVEDDM